MIPEAAFIVGLGRLEQRQEDHEMEVVRSKHGQTNYGIAVGILVIESQIPCIPGDVDNATTFKFPIRYEKIQEISMHDLLMNRTPEMLGPVLDACHRLISEGVRAITGDCGYLAYFQHEVADRLPIPVFLSSLLQAPFILSMLSSKNSLGIIVANSLLVDEVLLRNTKIQQRERLVISGMEEQPEFSQAMLGECGRLHPSEVERELLQVGQAMLDSHPSIGAFLLECSNLPPYSTALQRAFRLPVFDYVTMINYVHSALIREPFQGYL